MRPPERTSLRVVDVVRSCGLVAIFVGALLGAVASSGPAGAAVCSPPKTPAKASLELRSGELRYDYDLNTAEIREVVNGLQGYVAGPWHLPIGLTVAELSVRYETGFYYWKAQSVGHCVALAETAVSIGYDEMTVYVSREYPEGSCEYDAISAHEEEHVRINREVLQAYEGKFKAALARVLQGKKAIFAHTKDEARRAYLRELRRQVDSVASEMASERNRRNGAIDSEDNYRRLMAPCANWHGVARPASDPTRPDRQAAARPPAEGESAEGARPMSGPTAGPPAETNPADDQVAGSATGEAPSPAPGSDADPATLVAQGRRLSKANAEQLESALKSLPYHFPTRARLLGFYFHNGLSELGPAATIEARRRHVLWLIENRPDSPLAERPEALIDPAGSALADPEGYREAKDLWLAQAEKNQDDAAVRRHAAAFLRRHDAALSKTLP